MTQRFRFLALLIIPFLLCMCGVVRANAQQTADATAIAQGFKLQGVANDFTNGALVSTVSGHPDTVELATTDSASRLAGIVGNQTLLSLSNGTAQVQVVINGGTTVLVSDINGPVHAGDKVTASPIEGVGMFASGNEQVVGTAQSALDTQTASIQTVADRSGKNHNVHIGRVPLQVGVSYYQATANGFVPAALQNLADTIAGRPVSLIRLLACTLLLLLAFVSTAALLYTAVRSGLISIGRNPLAAGAIRRGLLQVGGAIILILVFALLASYIILTV